MDYAYCMFFVFFNSKLADRKEWTANDFVFNLN